MLHHARDYPPGIAQDRVRSGTWVRIRRGVYLAVPTPGHGLRPRDLQIAHVFAAVAQSRVPVVVSHMSAALLWGLPTLPGARRTHLVQPSRPSATHGGDVVRRTTVLSDSHVVRHLGVAVTTLERTVVDCSLVLPPEHSLVLADAALHLGADRHRCLEILACLGRRNGSRKALEVISLADGGAESPGESRARFQLLRAGLPEPETQVRTPTPSGVYWSDLGLVEWHLLIEYDGEQKYTVNGTAAQAVLKERRRDHALESVGQRILHIDKGDLRSAGVFLSQVYRHLPRAVVAALRPRRWLMR